MPLTDIQIAFLVERYSRERDRFEKMAATVARHLGGRLYGSAVPHLPTFRSKDPESLRGKLERDREKHDLRSFESEFAPSVLDLAGVRVLLYRPRDIEATCAAIEELFQIPPDPRFRKDFTDEERYQARHRVVALRDDYIASDSALANLCGVFCEIQIVTLGDHIWNELEHDIVYKKRAGRPSDEQAALLKTLRGQLNNIRDTVDLLMDATGRQHAANLAAIETPEDLRQALRKRCGRILGGELGRLLSLLMGVLRDVTPAKLEELPIGSSDLDRIAQDRSMREQPVPVDDVRVIVAVLWERYGQDFLRIAKSWPGRRGPLSQFVHALDESSQRGTI